VRSIRGRLTASLVLALLAALAIIAGTVHVSVRRSLQREFDATLLHSALALGRMVEFSEGRLDTELLEGPMPEYEAGAHADYFEVRGADGAVVARSESLAEDELPGEAGPLDQPSWRDLELPDGRSGRFASVRLTAANDLEHPAAAAELPQVVVSVARSREPLDSTLATLLRALLAASLAAALLAVALVHRAVRRGLAPIGALADTLGRVEASSLATRVATRDVAAELLPFCDRINALFERLQAAFERERRMTSAVAHELRTPVAELRAAVDVALRWPDDPELSRQALATADDVARRMTGLVAAILRAARVESGRAGVRVEPVALRELVAECWRPCEAQARERGVVLHNEVPADAALDSDRGLLALVVGNLLDNGARFAEPAGEVTVACDAGALEISNPAAGLQPQDLPRLTEPFWRGDAARSDSGHSGLGLSLVETVLRALGGRLGLALRDGRLVARVELGGLSRGPLTCASSSGRPDAR
jgi:signal transduction histidine kinase